MKCFCIQRNHSATRSRSLRHTCTRGLNRNGQKTCCMVAIQRDSVTLIYGASYSKYNSFSYSASAKSKLREAELGVSRGAAAFQGKN